LPSRGKRVVPNPRLPLGRPERRIYAVVKQPIAGAVLTEAQTVTPFGNTEGMTFLSNPSDRSRRNRNRNRNRNQNRRGRYTAKGTISTPSRPPCPCCVAEAQGFSPAEAEQQYLDRQQRAIDKFGFSICYVDDDDTPWAYTIGRTRRGLPELLIVGVDPETAQSVLSSVHTHAFPYEGDRTIDLLELHFPQFRFLEIPDRVWDTTDYLLGAAADARTFAPERQRVALQVVWSDTNGVFPWEPTFARWLAALQPIVGLSDK
jgi:Domain of unknown function (DUF4262)